MPKRSLDDEDEVDEIWMKSGRKSSDEIAESPLQSPFPASYEPTLREFLDTIALQTSSEWKYDPSGKYFKSEVEHEKPVAGLAIFEFTKANFVDDRSMTANVRITKK